MSDGWAESAEAWIADMGDEGDFGRRFVLDAPMLKRAAAAGSGPFTTVLDVGCGEGRFCRMLADLGMDTTGIDPTAALIDHARMLHPEGAYAIGRAERLDFADASFDLVVSYLALIDIPDIAAGIAEMARVLRPGGTLLIANLNSFNTASNEGWETDWSGHSKFAIDDYLDERANWVSWRGIRIQNWHRPLSTYMSLLIGQGLVLTHFAEPAPVGGMRNRGDRYRRVPWFMMMEWRKPDRS
ncbi:methyltransferase domain-containing protein [Sphingomonas aliaeris]|uniref:Methyltransferase domain-containing protein n=1 Tax=Sphingomonas aliaeris TaxID=2759526 RepID=A0A974S3W1_9SPHN|nr:class I SAM-dependent methyltransferase [Sphingomonas aliaeris]QQV76886.1 methyltransferase domain-containing protein [Sphingomonas aliaeris]